MERALPGFQKKDASRWYLFQVPRYPVERWGGQRFGRLAGEGGPQNSIFSQQTFLKTCTLRKEAVFPWLDHRVQIHDQIA